MNTLKEYIYEGFMYKLYVPNNFTNKKHLPLIVMLHGCDQDSGQLALETKMNLLAEKEHFIVLYPTMNRIYNPLFDKPHHCNPAGCWNWFCDENQQRGEGLPKILVEMIFDVEKKIKTPNRLTIDFNQIYAAGFSAGGAMANILGVTYPDLFSGIAICSGLPYGAVQTNLWKDPLNLSAEIVMRTGAADPYECGNKAFKQLQQAFKETRFKRKLPLLVFHGTKDTTVHPKNAKQIITQWGQMYFLLEGGKGKMNPKPNTVTADQIQNGRSFSRYEYHNKNGEPFMELWLIDEMGHYWSGGDKSGIFIDPLGPDASSIIWEFFQKTSAKL